MISVEKAVQIVLDAIEVLEPVKVSILSARERVLAEDVISNDDLPAFDYASMTGYALRAADIARASSSNPITIHLDGDLLPGQRWKNLLKPKHAVRINMGAPLPEEADSVLSEEHAVRHSNKKVIIYKAAKAGNNIRIKGEDIPKGALVLPKGRRLSATDIGTLSAIGLTEVRCFRVPKVSFLTSGNGIIDDETIMLAGITRSANRYTLHSQLAEYGVEPVDLGLTNHDNDIIQEKISEGLKYDIFVSSVGHSLEDFTYAKRMLEHAGLDIKFWKVAIKPATPIIFGLCGNIPVFGISGYPFSFYLVLEQFIRPALMKMMGNRIIRRAEVQATLTKDLRTESGITAFIRGLVTLTENGFTVTPDLKKSSSIRAFTTTNGLIVLPANSGYINAGSKVTVQIITEPKNYN